MSNKLITIIASSTAAALVLGFGAWSLGNRGSSSSAATPSAAVRQGGPPGQAGQMPPQGVPGTQGAPRGAAPPGFGTPVTGATAAKVKAAALAKYPGTVERVMQLQDGSYVVHVITSNGEVHVAVGKDFKVSGTEQGGPPPSTAPPTGTKPRGATT